MNRTLALATATAAFLLSSSALAQGYVAVDGGRTHLGGVCAQPQICGASAGAYRVTAGFQLGDGFSFEAAFLSLGKASSSSTDVTQSVQVRALQVGGLYEWDLNHYLALVARGGAEYQHGTSDTVLLPSSVSSTKSNGAAAYGGVGAMVTLAWHLRAQAGIEWSRADFNGSSSSIRTATAGLRYDF